MNKLDISSDVQEQVLLALKCIGYSKRLNSISPISLEGQIVSAADSSVCHIFEK